MQAQGSSATGERREAAANPGQRVDTHSACICHLESAIKKMLQTMQQGAENEDSLENRKDTWQLKSVFIADGADSKLENMKKKKAGGQGRGLVTKQRVRTRTPR